jgi:hypothetical protein
MHATGNSFNLANGDSFGNSASSVSGGEVSLPSVYVTAVTVLRMGNPYHQF